MPYIPHTEEDLQTMLRKIGTDSLSSLFSEIPPTLLKNVTANMPKGLSEFEVMRLLQQRAKQDEVALNFIGAGAYEHHIPAAVWDIVSRGEFLTSYTPYQAEASQGTLQVLYEFQTMIANLTGMEVANASLYDGGSALAEAVLMAIRCQDADKRTILIPKNVHPHYRQTVKTIASQQNISIVELPFDLSKGNNDPQQWTKLLNQEAAALIIPQPNFFGVLEEVDQLTDWAHQHQLMVIAVVNPMSLAVLKEPGSWGKQGADIVCGEAQPFGIPLASGGPYLGFLASKKKWVHELPGRLVGRTVDMAGNTAFTLTLQAREQHIRRAKATSNICTNQNLLVTAVTIYLSLLGAEGLSRVATSCYDNAHTLKQTLLAIPGIEAVFTQDFFHEFVVRLNKPVEFVLKELAHAGIQGGHSLTKDYPELGDALLVCVTETKNENDLHAYQDKLKNVLGK